MRFALELALTFAPFAILIALLIRRCFPGEGALIAHRLRSAARRLRPAKVRWRRAKVRAAATVARAAVGVRGPPVVA